MHYTKRRRRLNRTSGLFFLLLTLSLVSLLLPTRYTGRLIGLVQVLTPFQDAANWAADSVGNLGRGSAESPVTVEAYQALVLENQAYRNTIASLALRAERLERANRELLNIRNLGLGPAGALIPARVISDDLLSWRKSKLVDAGTLRGVRDGAAVASHHFTADAGSAAGARTGLQVLAAECLVGTVVQVATHTSRVRLLTDPETKMPVAIGRLSEDGLKPLASEFWLVGAGRAGLQIRDVDHRYIESGAIKVGDIVLTSGDDPGLPVPAVIGTVTTVRRAVDNGLIYILGVTPAVSPDRLRRVYIVDAGEGRPAG